MQDAESQYFLRRAEEERIAAGRATCDCARDVHLDLATRYETAAAVNGTTVLRFEAKRVASR